jgi:hypothetical protein
MCSKNCAHAKQSALKLAERELDDAQLVVARAAQELVDFSEPMNLERRGSEDVKILVDAESMDSLKEALKDWKDKTEAFLKTQSEVENGS